MTTNSPLNTAAVPGQIIAPEPMRTVKLDVVDRKILYLLLNNSRLTSTRIGKILKVPKEMVMYRINKLVKEGVIVEFYTIVNTEKLGYVEYMLNLVLKNTSEAQIHALIEHLQKHHFVNWVMSSSGQWDIMTLIKAKNRKHFDEIMSSIFNYLGDKLGDYHVFLILDFQHTTPAYLTQDLKMPSLQLKGKSDSSFFHEFENVSQNKSEALDIDAKDMKLLHEISSNARLGLNEIAEKIGLSSDAVTYRIKRLIKQDVIKGFKVRLNHFLFGYQYQFLFVKMPYIPDDKKKHFYHFCSTHPSVNATFKLIGQWNFCFEVFSKDALDVKKFMTELKQHFGDYINHITPAIEFNQNKFTYLPEGIVEEMENKLKIKQ